MLAAKGRRILGGADVFLKRFREARPTWDIDVMDIWRERLPEFEGPALEAKYAIMNGRAFDSEERDAFAVIERMAVRLSVADRVLISTPMWNFSIPYKLKQFILETAVETFRKRVDGAFSGA